MADLKRAIAELAKGGSLTLASLTTGSTRFASLILTRALAREAENRAVVLVHVARDSQRASALAEALSSPRRTLRPSIFPPWDCQPYDRVSPNASIAARRMIVLSRLARSRSSEERPRILSTTIKALLQRVAPLQRIAGDTFSAAPGNAVDMDALMQWLETNGFTRASTVRDAGEYAVRGGILDLFAPGMAQPVRLDFFGDTLETIRAFDPESQRTIGPLRGLDLVPMSEVQLTTDAMRRFRQAYVTCFGAQTRGDGLYEAISEGRRHAGYEHWLPLFYDRLDTVFDYAGRAPLIFDPLIDEAAHQRLALIDDYYEARKTAYDADPAHSNYKPLKPDQLYLSEVEWKQAHRGRSRRADGRLSHSPKARAVLSSIAARSRGAALRRNAPDENANVFSAAVEHVKTLQAERKRVVLAAWSDGLARAAVSCPCRPRPRQRRANLLAGAGAGAAAIKRGHGGHWP